MEMKERIENLLGEVELELSDAMKKHKRLNSVHEAYAIILEELDEFWEQVKLRRHARNTVAMKIELRQIAAMAVRTIVDCGLDME